MRQKKNVKAEGPVGSPKPKKPIYKKWWFWIVIVIVLIICISQTSTPTEIPPVDEDMSEITEDISETIDTQTDSTIVDSAVSDSPAPEDNTETTSNVYGEGMYKIGSDIPAGEYFISATGSFGAYIEITSDSSGNFDSIITNDNINTFGFITVEDGQYLKVDRGEIIEAAKAVVPAPINGVYGEGMYRVGTDIPAGEYKVTCTGNVAAYIEITTNSTGAFDSIVTNNNIETSGYITIEDGQYIAVARGELALAE